MPERMEDTPFALFCRQPGTRINDIMTRIERGQSNAKIAAAYNTGAGTINVYRKALRGRLTPGSLAPRLKDTGGDCRGRPASAKDEDDEKPEAEKASLSRETWAELADRALAMAEAGLKSREIAKRLRITQKAAWNLLYRARKRRKSV